MTTAAPPEPPEERVGLSTNAAGHVVPSAWARARARVRLEDPFVGWTASIAVALLALFLRLWNLGKPRVFEFDETYYAKDAWSLLRYGYVRGYTENANDQILAGQTTGHWKDDPSMIVHPEVGKWLIALGEKAFGMDPFGWRISAAVVGALMVLVMCRLARRVTGSTALGIVAGLLLSFDGLQFVLSRLALLDIFLAFFLLLRRALPGRRPRLVPSPDGPAGARTGRGRRRLGAGARAAVPALAAGRGRQLRARDRHQVDGGVRPGGVRPAGLVLVRRRAPLLRRPVAGAPLRGRRRHPGVRAPRPGRVRRVRRAPGPAG